MFTTQAPSIGNNLIAGGMSPQQANAVQNLVGQCRAPLVHRGPVRLDYTRQNMRLITPEGPPPFGMWPPMFPGGGPPPQTFPPMEDPGGQTNPPKPPEASGGNHPKPPPAFNPPETADDPPPPEFIFGADTWVFGDRARIEVQPQFYPGLTAYKVMPINLAKRTFVTDVFVDDDKLLVEKREYVVWVVGEKDPTVDTIAEFKEKARVTDVYSTGSSLLKDTKTVKVLVLFPADGETDATASIIDMTECPSP